MLFRATFTTFELEFAAESWSDAVRELSRPRSWGLDGLRMLTLLDRD